MSLESGTRPTPPRLRPRVEIAEGQYLVHVSGRLGLTAATLLQSTLEQALLNAKRIVVDADTVTSITSSGLAALLAWRRRCQQQGVEFSVRSGAPKVKRLLEITELAKRPPLLPRRSRTPAD